MWRKNNKNFHTTSIVRIDYLELMIHPIVNRKIFNSSFITHHS